MRPFHEMISVELLFPLGTISEERTLIRWLFFYLWKKKKTVFRKLSGLTSGAVHYDTFLREPHTHHCTGQALPELVQRHVLKRATNNNCNTTPAPPFSVHRCGADQTFPSLRRHRAQPQWSTIIHPTPVTRRFSSNAVRIDIYLCVRVSRNVHDLTRKLPIRAHADAKQIIRGREIERG
jgi:hypothetical protein